jgi:5'-nucleotidase (lipoprotein e(P4) family)
MRLRGFIVVSTLAAVLGGVVLLQGRQRAPFDTGTKYTRDSEEYATLARQVYRLAGEAVGRAAQGFGARPWAAILDIDETALDNSTYQLERATYNLPFDDVSWDAWVTRREAGAVPGVADFIASVRRAGGHVAWITNRDATVVTATRANLQAVHLWNDDDRLCVQDSAARTKRIRRGEVVAGQGACAWSGQPMQIAALVGDQMGDFPEADEKIPNTGTDAAFGHACFLLPNAMYGGWTTKVTRVR